MSEKTKEMSIEDFIKMTVSVLKDCYENGNKVLLCGNGGSAADCEHIVGELMKTFTIKRSISEEEKNVFKVYDTEKEWFCELAPAFAAISLSSHVGLITALCNDGDANNMYAQQLYVLGNAGDVLWAISTSGNSENVIRAAITARVKGMKVIAFTGKDGGRLKEYADVLVNAPSNDIQEIQELHISIYHKICMLLEQSFFAE